MVDTRARLAIDKGVPRKVFQIEGDDDRGIRADGCRQDMTVFGVASHPPNECVVSNDFCIRKRDSHGLYSMVRRINADMSSEMLVQFSRHIRGPQRSVRSLLLRVPEEGH